MKKMTTYLVFFLCLFCCNSLRAQKKSPQEKQPWTAQEIRLINRSDEIVAVLENGMVAIVKENHTAPVAAVRLYVKAGSIYEQEFLGAGMSHLFEHLLAGGATKDRTEKQSRELIEEIGAKYNAFTGKARTCYYLTAPSQHVGKALNLIADWVTRPTFPEDAFKREWGVVQRELEMGASDPYRLMWKLMDELRYKVHPASYPIIGHQDIVKQLTREDILTYYRRMYVPDNCVIVIVGDVNAEEMFTEIKKEFADFTRKARKNIVLPEEPDVTAPREIVKVVPSMKGPAKLVTGFPSFKLQDKDLYALDALANILGGGKSSRMYQSLREKKQLVISVNAVNYTPSWAKGTFLIFCDVEPAKVPATRRAIWEEIDRVKREGVKQIELERTKRQLQVEHIRSHQTAEQQAGTMAEDYLATGDAHFSDHYVENMQKVTAEQVQKMADKYLMAAKQMTLVLSGQPLVETEDQTTQLTEKSPVKLLTLKNGLRVLLRRNLSVPLVNMQCYVMGGLLEESDTNNGLTNLMVRLSAKGTKNYHAKQIIDYFDNAGGSIETGAGNNTYFYQAEVMAQDFGKAFDIFSEVISQPTFPKNELDKLKPQILAGIKQIKNSWPQEGGRFFREKFFLKSPYQRISSGRVDSVSNLTREQILQFHRNATVGSRMVLAIFGDIDLAETEKIVQEKLGILPQGNAIDLSKITGEPAPAGRRLFVEKTEKPGATVHIGFPGMKLTDIKDRYPMEILTQIVGSNTGWLHELLRGKQLVYYAWGYSFYGVSPGYIVATAQCEAKKVPEVMKLIEEQLAKAAQGMISEAEVARAKSKRINTEVLNKQTNADMAATVALDELYGLGYKWSESYTDRIMAVRLEDVKKVASKYLKSPPTITIKTSEPKLLKQN